MILLDEVTNRMTQERLVHATLMAGNRLAKGAQLPDPDDSVKKFNDMLESDLQMEKKRKAALRLVSSL